MLGLLDGGLPAGFGRGPRGGSGPQQIGDDLPVPVDDPRQGQGGDSRTVGPSGAPFHPLNFQFWNFH